MKNVLLVNAPLTILFLSDTYGGRTHDKRIAEATPYPLPSASQLLQDWAFSRSRCLMWTCSCQRENLVAKSSLWRSN